MHKSTYAARLAALLACLMLFVSAIGLAEDVATDGEAQPSCGHEQSKGTGETHEENVTYTSDASGHVRHYTLVSDQVCASCGVAMDALRDEKSDEVQLHAFLGDKCTVCEYPCAHPGMESAETLSDSTYELLNETQHTRIWTVTTTEDCPICDYANTETEEKRETVDHTLGGDGACVCGYCSHQTVNESREASPTTFSIVDANGHIKHWTDTVTKTCAYCGEIVEIAEVPMEEAEEHKNITPRKEVSTPIYVPEQEAGHKKSWTEKTVRSCDDCWYVFDPEVVEMSEPLEAHQYSGGQCEKCWYTCEHPTNDIREWEEVTEYKKHDGFSHVVNSRMHHQETCTVCNIAHDTVSDNPYRYEHHVWENGACALCGEVQEVCDHDPGLMITYPERNTRDYAAIDEKTHQYTYDASELQMCEDCMSFISEKPLGVKQGTAPHEFKDGVCTFCGYKNACLHDGEIIEANHNWRDHRDFKPVDEKNHQYVVDIYVQCICAKCGEIIFDLDKIWETVTQTSAHSFVNGVCNDCGYESGCAHQNTEKMLYERRGKAVAFDALGHTMQYDKMVYDVFCQDCGEHLGQETVENVQQNEPHNFTGGKCSECGYANACPHTDVETYEQRNTVKVLAQGETTHTVISGGKRWYFCVNCGEHIKGEELPEVEITEPHAFEHGGCVICSCINPCTHEHTYVDQGYCFMHDYVSISDEEHQFKAQIEEAAYCEDCGEWLGTKVLEADGIVTEPHLFTSAGVCRFCGAKLPVVTPTPKPTEAPMPTPEPTAKPTEAPAEPDPTPKPTPKPTKKPVNNEDNYFSPTAVPTAAPTAVPPAAQEPESGADLVTTLTEAVAKAEEEGSTVSVEVVGAQEVLSAQEYTELRKLPAQEQILVTLSSIGFDEVVEAAMSTLNVTLSDQASGLMTQVSARMQSANEQDKAALEEKLARYFPTKEVVVGGVRSTYFIIDLRIEVDGVARIQRYGFQLDENGEWIFVELSVEEA